MLSVPLPKSLMKIVNSTEKVDSGSAVQKPCGGKVREDS